MCYFLPLTIDTDKDTNVGTTKLTRKEILAEDPIHGSIIMLVEFFSKNKTTISILVAAAIIVAAGVYWGNLYLEGKEEKAQETLGRGIQFYHAEIDPDASDDPFGNGPVAKFKNDTLKYQAATVEFESIVSGLGHSGVAPIARYYLGLIHLKKGETDTAIENLERVSGNSKSRTLGQLARQLLARIHVESGNYEDARNVLQSMIKDPEVELPKEELRIQLSRILAVEGDNEAAVKVLQEGAAEGSSLSPLRQKLMAELDKLQTQSQLDAQH